MKLLTNMPLECFEDRSRYPDLEVLSYGPAERGWVDDMHYPPDLVYDPVFEHLDNLFARLPDGFVPDALLIYWPDQEPIPLGLETCPVPVVGVISDYNLSLPLITGLWAWFDLWLCDRAGQDLFSRLSFADTRYWCQYTYKAPSHRLYRGVPRELDMGFAGNLTPWIQAERSPWLERMLALGEQGIHCEVRAGIYGAEYGRFLNRCRIGFNRSIRGEMNLRGFEVPACGGLLMMEAENLEVRDFFVPDEEVILYTADNFEARVEALLARPAHLRSIAAAGHERVKSHSLSQRLAELATLLQTPGPARQPASALDRDLSRGTAMLGTWAKGEAHRFLLECLREHPDDPRVLNATACALVMRDGKHPPAKAIKLLDAARRRDPSYLPARFNLWFLLRHLGHPQTAELQQELTDLLQQPCGWDELDGVYLPADFSPDAVLLAGAMQRAIRALEPGVLRQCLSGILNSPEPALC